jgi:segregation and condensation protein B
LARKLIATAGRKQVIGRPILYKTTREFLLRFGLKDVAELPSMEEFEKMAAIELDEPESTSVGNPASASNLNQSLDLDESNGDEPDEEVLDLAPETSHLTETDETSARLETPLPAEAAPAAPPSTEQAETENLPHGDEEVHDHPEGR